MSADPQAAQTALRGKTGFDHALVAALVILTFFASYAIARSATSGTLFGSSQPALMSLEELTPYPTVEDGIQQIYVDTAYGFNPQTIMAKAGMPLEIEFGPAGGDSNGCYSSVRFPELGIPETDLIDGATVVLPALEPGQYQWACWMDMAYGLIVVQ